MIVFSSLTHVGILYAVFSCTLECVVVLFSKDYMSFSLCLFKRLRITKPVGNWSGGDLKTYIEWFSD